MNVLAIIAARKGSAGVPDKNIRLCGGKPLIQWTIEAAKKSHFITDIVVITDSEEIARLARQRGIDVIDEPAELAKKTARIGPVYLHAFKSFVKIKPQREPDIIVGLQPTSPLRTGTDIDKAISLLNATPQANFLISVYSFLPAQWGVRVNADGFLDKAIPGEEMLRSHYQPIYVPDGAIGLATKRYFLTDPGLAFQSKVLPYIMKKENSGDIDDESDFQRADLLLRKRIGSDLKLQEFDNLHKGQRAWIVSPGPSLGDVTDEQWKQIDKEVTFGVSHAVGYHDCRYLVVGEVECLDLFPCYAASKAEYKFVTEGPQIQTSFPSIRFPHTRHPTTSLAEGLAYGFGVFEGTSIPALNLALIMGCNPIILLGIDYTTWEHVHPIPGDSPDKEYGVLPDGSNPGKEGLRVLGEHAQKLGRTIINASPISTLECFSKMSVQEILNGETIRDLYCYSGG